MREDLGRSANDDETLEPSAPTFGAWLKLRRIALDLTQQELADQAGCSVGTIRKIESDERKPSKQLAELLGVCLNVPETEQSAFIAFARNERAQPSQLSLADAPWKLATPPVHDQSGIRRLQGRYELHEMIAKGGMGEVYRGVDSQTGQVIAIKALKSTLVEPELVARFKREGTALHQLNHPNIVGLLAAIEEGGQPYLIMEYVSGGTLQARLAQEPPLLLNRILHITLELCDALTRTHYRQIIHRDIKPANILLSEDGTPRLADFGVARLGQAERVTQTGTAIGTLDYLAPEALNGETVDARCDIWSLGVLLFEMLTGQRPFRGDNLTALVVSILNHPPPDLSNLRLDLPPALVDLVNLMLQKEPQQRITSARLVGAALEAILAGNELPQIDHRAGDVTTPFVSSEKPQPEMVKRHNLPATATFFIGREVELTKLADLLADPTSRLLTIVGPGGMGKTQLALAVGKEQVAKTNFPDGVYFVSLAPLSEPAAIVPAIAEAVGYSFQNDGRTPQQQLFDYCQQKTMLLLLDNFEHLLEGATLIADLFQQAPHLKILATSRERLNLYEEQRYLLQGLTLPDLAADTIAENAAVSLFVQSARRGQPDFALASTDFPYVVDICRLVEGMPLGLELAASWVELLSLGEIAAEIQRSLDFLETELRDVPARHRSMRAVFDTSWQGLSKMEQANYAQLSVFRSGFTQEAAQAVTDTSLRTLARFVNKSLLRYNQTQKRYEIHELLRQYAAEYLEHQAIEISETLNISTVRDRHTAYYCVFLQQREADLKGRRQQEALAEIEADRENASIAWQWAVEQIQLTQLEQALVSLALFYQWYGHLYAGETMCRMATEKLAIPIADIEIIDQSPAYKNQARLLVKLLTWQGVFNIALAQRELVQQALQQAQNILDGPILRDQDTTPERAFLLLALSDGTKNDYLGDEELSLNEQSLALYRQMDDRWGMAYALELLSDKHRTAGNPDQAVKLMEACLAIRQQLNDPRGIAKAYNLLGHMILFAGQIEVSERYLRKSLALFETLDNRADLAQNYEILSINFQFGGKFRESVAAAEASWAIHEALGIPHESSTANVSMTRSRVDLGLYEDARKQAETNFITFKALNLQWQMAFTLFNLGRIDLGEGDVRQALKRLQESADTLKKLNTLPLLVDVLFCLAYVFRILGERQRMVDTLIEALKMVSARVNVNRFELPAMALLLADRGENERAIEFYAAALQSPYIANSRWFEDIAGRTIAEVAATLPLAVVEAAKERGRTRDLQKTRTEMLAELEWGDWLDGRMG